MRRRHIDGVDGGMPVMTIVSKLLLSTATALLTSTDDRAASAHICTCITLRSVFSWTAVLLVMVLDAQYL
jgi:hypothetical protein